MLPDLSVLSSSASQQSVGPALLDKIRSSPRASSPAKHPYGNGIPLPRAKLMRKERIIRQNGNARYWRRFFFLR